MGQGLAGSVLALKLIENNFSVMVIDKPELSNCSKVAAGIFNPIIFKRLSKSWMADEILPEMLRFYKEVGKNLNCKLIIKRNIVKLFSEQQEVDLWHKKANGELKKYLYKEIYTENHSQNIKQSEFGFSKVTESGNLNVNLFLESTRKYLTEKNSFANEKFEYTQLITSEKIIYKEFVASKIIFAEGYLVKHNPFFNYIPLKPAKGEILTIESNDLKIETDIINKNGFIFSDKENQFKTGATYNWEDLNDNTSQNGLIELQEKLKKITVADYKIKSHNAGVRPSVIDRRPVLGKHPQYNNLFVFNGMGTKGVMLAPYFAEQLLNYISKNSELNAEVNVERFRKYLATNYTN